MNFKGMMDWLSWGRCQTKSNLMILMIWLTTKRFYPYLDYGDWSAPGGASLKHQQAPGCQTVAPVAWPCLPKRNISRKKHRECHATLVLRNGSFSWNVYNKNHVWAQRGSWMHLLTSHLWPKTDDWFYSYHWYLVPSAVNRCPTGSELDLMVGKVTGQT